MSWERKEEKELVQSASAKALRQNELGEFKHRYWVSRMGTERAGVNM